ncbi:putative phosphoesterase [Deinococcus metalli]|uniref:Phosphoesterase n=1 Tax=Deinococcus metalli TaxID=1141878 RepID=A0A7W8KJM3_9DEIO|nr:metallophosphoesterase family protein [Deinococcus metalli]MBB5379140.1 putative phosphoesterase [Deinococcus metalli]GHF64946.1 phosphoesterase [Deinococcus metalli]
MRIGLIADIQGNRHALDAVLAELGRFEVYTTLCAGDLVGYAAHPNDLVLRLRAEAIPSVLGNQDQACGWRLTRANLTPGTPHTEILRRAALEWTQAELLEEHRAYLRGLPRLMRLPLAGHSVTVLHGGLSRLDEQLTPDVPAVLEALARQLKSDVVILGHSHQAFVHSCAETLIINPGSVGRSVNGDPRARFAVLDLANLHVELCRVDYDLAGATDAILRSALPMELGLLLARGQAARGEARAQRPSKEHP